jgi:histidine ammonia-lyase
MSVRITGRGLAPASLAAIARHGAPVVIDAGAQDRIRAAAAVVARAVQAGRPVYGVTTGLGPRVVEPVSAAEAAAFSLRTLRGRATAVGAPLSRECSRAAMAVRLNGLCAGGAGVGLAVAEGLAGLLNAGVHPIIPAAVRSVPRICVSWPTSAWS